jgi:hypothetical protein
VEPIVARPLDQRSALLGREDGSLGRPDLDWPGERSDVARYQPLPQSISKCATKCRSIVSMSTRSDTTWLRTGPPKTGLHVRDRQLGQPKIADSISSDDTANGLVLTIGGRGERVLDISQPSVQERSKRQGASV